MDATQPVGDQVNDSHKVLVQNTRVVTKNQVQNLTSVNSNS